MEGKKCDGGGVGGAAAAAAVLSIFYVLINLVSFILRINIVIFKVIYIVFEILSTYKENMIKITNQTQQQTKKQKIN